MPPFNLTNLLRPHIIGLTPYASARDEFTGKAEVYLDANENALGTAGQIGDFNRYPDPLQRDVKAQLATLKGVSPEQIFLGNGSDEAIDLLFRAFCEPGKDEVIILPPTYGMYRVSAAINDVKVIEVPLQPDFQLNVPAILSAITPRTKLLFICSPNNPSGNLMAREAIDALVAAAPCLVIVDEAYIDFAPGASQLLRKPLPSNLVVLQTFSKAWGMAHLRLGMAFGSPELIDIFNKIKPPYNVNGMTQQLALKALAKVDNQLSMAEEIVTERKMLREKLREIPLVERVFPSDANFLLVRVDDADRRYQQLIERQIIVRNRSRVLLCEGCLRVTVGTPQENQKLLNALQEISNDEKTAHS
jgi:histidinol-phosphate aminotransferase